LSYRPAVGEIIFVSTYNNKPRLVKIEEYEYCQEETGDVVFFTFQKPGLSFGAGSYCRLDSIEFHPEVPTNTDVVYKLISVKGGTQGNYDLWEIEYYFEPEVALGALELYESGKLKLSIGVDLRHADLMVVVERL
jgi:hypothetical protein